MKRLILLAGLLLAGFARAEEPSAEVDPTLAPAPLVVWNREITVFRAPIGNLTPTQRRDTALARMSAVSDLDLYQPVRIEPITVGDIKGVSFMIGDKHLLSLAEEDLDPTLGTTVKEEADAVLGRLEELREAKRTQRSLPVILRGVGVALAATVAFGLLVWVLRWLGRKLRRFVVQRTAKLKQLKVQNFDFRPIMLQAVRRVLVMIGWLVALAGAYVWIGTVLAQFPYTSPWGEILGHQVHALAVGMLHGILGALPGLAVVVIIFAITRWVANIADHLFRQLEHGRDTERESWLGRDTARATRRIVVVLIWIFGVTLAYPYIPGSDSPAFKGISVLVGLMISLGSTGLVNQVMSGFVVLYSGSVRTGEYARVGDTEGVIQEISLLSTKVLTPRREYVTVPNAVVISKETLNYSRMEENNQRTELCTKVTIGYDTPWRQVHAMLLLAAERTPGIRKQPEPRVVQTALSDFYAEYELRFVPADVSKKGAVLSELHQRVQDVFNEFGVQIMSPNFVAQPEQAVVSPKDQWFAEPAKDPSRKNGEGN